MHNNVLPISSHLKTTVNQLKNRKGIPFQTVLCSEEVQPSLEKIDYRARYNFYPPEIIVWLFLSQVLGNESLDKSVARLIAHYAATQQTLPSSNTSAYSQARSKLPEELLSDLARSSAHQVEKQMPEAFSFCGHKIKLVDGSTISMPDTAANQKAYPQPSIQKEGVGFPLARIVTVTSFSSGMMLDLAIGPYSGKGTSEHALLRPLLSNFQSGDLVIADAYYATYFLMAYFIKHKIFFIFPELVFRSHDFRMGIRLGKKDHIIQWKKPRKPEWMDEETYRDYPDTITLRELEIEKTTKGFRTKKKIMVTNFLNEKKVTPLMIGELYSSRWFVELDIRTIKQTLHMDILKGKTPASVRKEIWACILAYNLIRKIMAQAAIMHDKNPRQLSFTHAMNLMILFRDKIIFSEKNESIYRILLKKIAEREIGNRPGRHEPRRVKRRPRTVLHMKKPRHEYKRVV